MRERLKLKNKNKPRVNLKHPAHYTLAWIIYIDNIYNIYRTPKNKYYKYLIRIYWIIDKKQYKNAKYIYRWHPIEV